MSERSYSDLVSTTIESIKRSAPANHVRIENLNELFDLIGDEDEASLFILTAEPQQVIICCDGDCHRVHSNQHSPKQHYIRFGLGNPEQAPTLSVTPITIRVDEFNISSMIVYLQQYFLWFGVIETIYILGTTVAVFRMKPFAVECALGSSVHDISVSRSLVLNQPSETPNLADTDHLLSIQFTTNRIGSDCLSLNGILSLLKYVDSQSVVMVRRVNRLGFSGSSIIERFFEQGFGKVSKVFLLPLRSRKKNVNLPSKTGFVVMASRKACAKVLERSEYYIQPPGITIAVGKFTHRALIQVTTDVDE